MKVKEFMTMLSENGNPYLVERSSYHVDGRKTYGNPDAIAEFARDALRLGEQADERLWCFCFDRKLHMIGCFEVSHGSSANSPFPRRETMQKILLVGASYVAFAHNHPADDPTPSDEDVAGTKSFVEAAKLLDVGVVDHLVIARSGWASMRALGLAEFAN